MAKAIEASTVTPTETKQQSFKGATAVALRKVDVSTLTPEETALYAQEASDLLDAQASLRTAVVRICFVGSSRPIGSPRTASIYCIVGCVSSVNELRPSECTHILEIQDLSYGGSDSKSLSDKA